MSIFKSDNDIFLEQKRVTSQNTNATVYKPSNIKFQTFPSESSATHRQYLSIILNETYQTYDFSLTNIYHKRHEL